MLLFVPCTNSLTYFLTYFGIIRARENHKSYLWDSVAEGTETSVRKRQNSLGLESKRRRSLMSRLSAIRSLPRRHLGLWRWPFRSNRLSQVRAMCVCRLAAEFFSHLYVWSFTQSKQRWTADHTCQQGRCHCRNVTLTIHTMSRADGPPHGCLPMPLSVWRRTQVVNYSPSFSAAFYYHINDDTTATRRQLWSLASSSS